MDRTDLQTAGRAAQTELLVSGMTCGNCARHAREALGAVPGVLGVAVDLESGTAQVRWAPEAKSAPGPLLVALEQAGYSGRVRETSAAPGRGSWRLGWRFNVVFGLGVTIPLMALEWGAGAGLERWYQWLSFGLVLPVQVLCGWKFYAGAWRQLKAGQSNMDTLVSLGSSTAFLYSVWGLAAGWRQHLYFMDAAAIISLVSLGHFLEEKASAQAASALRALLKLAPETARRIAGGREETVAVAELRPGDQVTLRAGDRVPADGEVLAGESAMDEAMLTGEPMPVEKGPGSKVFAGTINTNGRLTLRVTGAGEATALARIIEIVGQAQSSRAGIQRLGDRVSSVFVPVVVLVALATGLVWGLAPELAQRVHAALSPFLWPGHPPATPLAAAIYHSAAVLIIACPCAMGLATPIAIMAGTNAAARRGILIRDGEALEKSGRISAIVFDKTGTLTAGKASLAAVEELDQGAAALGAGLAGHSAHPLSRAIAAAGAGAAVFEDVRERRGAGLEGKAGGDVYRLGSLRWLAENGADLAPAADFSSRWTRGGATITGLSRGGRLIALFALKDALKPRAREVAGRLARSGLKVFLVTGDNRHTAEAIAAQAGIPLENVRAEASPEQKLEIIRELQGRGERVAFAGDGINDAPALAQADLGIALLAASDVARESADVVLLNADLEAIPEALALAQRTLRTIKQNLFWAFFYNAAGVPLAALGFLSPVFSAFAMGMSDLIVVGNALRLRWVSRRVSPDNRPDASGANPRQS